MTTNVRSAFTVLSRAYTRLHNVRLVLLENTATALDKLLLLDHVVQDIGVGTVQILQPVHPLLTVCQINTTANVLHITIVLLAQATVFQASKVTTMRRQGAQHSHSSLFQLLVDSLTQLLAILVQR